MDINQLLKSIFELHKSDHYYPRQASLHISVDEKNNFQVSFDLYAQDEPTFADQSFELAVKKGCDYYINKLEEKQKKADQDHKESQLARQQLLNKFKI